MYLCYVRFEEIKKIINEHLSINDTNNMKVLIDKYNDNEDEALAHSI